MRSSAGLPATGESRVLLVYLGGDARPRSARYKPSTANSSTPAMTPRAMAALSTEDRPPPPGAGGGEGGAGAAATDADTVTVETGRVVEAPMAVSREVRKVLWVTVDTRAVAAASSATRVANCTVVTGLNPVLVEAAKTFRLASWLTVRYPPALDTAATTAARKDVADAKVLRSVTDAPERLNAKLTCRKGWGSLGAQGVEYER